MIAVVSAASLLPRILPVALLSRWDFPAPVKKWLSYVAPSVLGTLTAISVLAPRGQIEIKADNLYLWAFLPALITAVKSRNLFYTLLAGILALAILNFVFGG